jgi:hypothetical protein
MDKFISEEIQRMTLLSKYDNSKTLSEQSVAGAPNYGIPDFGAMYDKVKQNVSNPGVFPAWINQLLKLYPKNSQVINYAGKQAVQLSYQNSEIIYLENRWFQYPKGVTKGEPVMKGSWKLENNKIVAAQDATAQNNGVTANKPKANVQIPVPPQLKNYEGITAFQDWLDVNAPGWATGYRDGILNKGQNGGGYGKFGPRTNKAWATYKDKYLAEKGPQQIDSKQAQEIPVEEPALPERPKAPSTDDLAASQPPTKSQPVKIGPNQEN